FEIRVICDPDDTDRIVAALDSTFTVGIVSVYPTRDGKQNRLYAHADHPADHPEPEAGPTPGGADEAYAAAPSLLREMVEVLEMGRDVDPAEDEDVSARTWSYWVRRAALLDRIALQEAATCPPGVADESAERAEIAAWMLAVLGHKDGSEPDAEVRAWPRGYVRKQYAAHRLQGCTCRDLFAHRLCPVHPNPYL
ncbi:hypothetical protein AB0G83_26325, partial [Streptomyces klenkii]|uniref:hypothetical protein n=1 Tax=Streptomyces klenkii TaxID=1420899 RepID=UPI0033FE781D